MLKGFKITIITGVLILISSCSTAPRVEPGSGSPPVIDDYYASKTADYSGNWKLFIKAHDPDGDMRQVTFKIDQEQVIYRDILGNVFLPGRLKEKMDGYFYMQPPLSRLKEGSVDLTVSVTITDHALNNSRTIKLPLSFGLDKGMEPDPEGYQNDSLLPIPYTIKSKFGGKDDD